MAEFTSTNTRKGGVYQAGTGLDVNTITVTDTDVDISHSPLMIDVCDDNNLTVALYSNGEDDDLNHYTQFTVPEPDRAKFIAYLRFVANMLERPRNK